MGRPPKPKGEKLSERVFVNMTPAERARLEALALKAGVSISDLLMKPWRKQGEA